MHRVVRAYMLPTDAYYYRVVGTNHTNHFVWSRARTLHYLGVANGPQTTR